MTLRKLHVISFFLGDIHSLPFVDNSVVFLYIDSQVQYPSALGIYSNNLISIMRSSLG